MKRLKDLAATILEGVLVRVILAVIAAGGLTIGGVEIRWRAAEHVDAAPPPERPGWVAPVQTIGFIGEEWITREEFLETYCANAEDLDPECPGYYRGSNGGDDDDDDWIKRPPK